MQPRPSRWADAPAHAAEVLDLYRCAPTDAAAFADLVRALHFDPRDGRPVPSVDDDLASRPGIRLLPQGWEQHVREAAWHYLRQGNPPGPDILDTLTGSRSRPRRGTWPLPSSSGTSRLAAPRQLLADAVPDRRAPSVLVTAAGADSPRGPDPRQVLLALHAMLGDSHSRMKRSLRELRR
jgi:hypothetical protein